MQTIATSKSHRWSAFICTLLCTPGMGVNSWGEVSEFTKPSPLYVNPANFLDISRSTSLRQVEDPDPSGGKIVRFCLEPTVGALGRSIRQSYEPTNRNSIVRPSLRVSRHDSIPSRNNTTKSGLQWRSLSRCCVEPGVNAAVV